MRLRVRTFSFATSEPFARHVKDNVRHFDSASPLLLIESCAGEKQFVHEVIESRCQVCLEILLTACGVACYAVGAGSDGKGVVRGRIDISEMLGIVGLASGSLCCAILVHDF